MPIERQSAASDMTRLERRTVLYSGHVQGVGFRYTTRQIAQQYQVDGYVRNLPDGRVEVVAEGLPSELDQFLAAVQQRMGGLVHDICSDISAASGGHSGFTIRY